MIKHINHKNIILGKDVSIGHNCTFDGIKDTKGEIWFGDFCSIRENCRFYVREKLTIGDYGTIHNNTLFQGYKTCKIGHNAWIGQNSIINFTDNLTIGNNFGIGVSSKIWTHAFFGELLLGCKIAIGIPDFESRSGSVVIGDDFWGIGQITISPGVKIGNKVIALTNSLITKDIPDNTIVAGIPAKPVEIDGDFRAYKELNEKEKFELMKNFAIKFAELKNIEVKYDYNISKKITLGNNQIVIHTGNEDKENSDITYFDIIKRTYTKKHNPLEVEFMKYILDYKARFVPE
ncbi:MAG TPA: hypothetical protein VN704_10790 [Verrucomicrobiae bacterium]|nr:hypothetical protein [Verrucomicrobiae bacterium]